MKDHTYKGGTRIQCHTLSVWESGTEQDVLSFIDLCVKGSSSRPCCLSTLFIPTRSVIKLKIHVPFGLRSVLSTKVYILELLWFASLERWGALALALVAFLSAIPQYLWSLRGLMTLRGWWCCWWAWRRPWTPKPWELHIPGTSMVIRGAGPLGLQTVVPLVLLFLA